MTMKTTSILLFAAVMMLSSCGITAYQASSSDGQMFQDGIYSNTPSFLSKAEKKESQAEVEALVQKTKESEIYLFGEKKDTVMIPENFYATIQFDQKVGGTTVTVGEYPYITDYGYYYGPYSIGSSWYWSRHYSPLYRSYYSPYFSAYYSPYWSTFSYNPWRYHSYYDPWYHSPWYAGSYWGWHDPWHHYHHHCGWYNPPHHIKPGGPAKPGHHDRPDNRWHGLRAETGSGPAHSSSMSRASSGGTLKGGASIGNRTGRASSGSRNQTVYRKPSTTSSQRASSSSTAYRRPASTSTNTNTSASTSRTEKQQPTFSSGGSRTGSSSYSRSGSSSSYSRGSSSSSYNRSSSSSGSSSYSRSSSSSGSSSYSRGSGGSYRR